MSNLKTINIIVDRLSSAIYNTPVKFSDLSDEHKVELRRLRMRGRTIEVWLPSVDGWREVACPMWCSDECYRVRKTEKELKADELEDELLALSDEYSRKEEELEMLLR